MPFPWFDLTDVKGHAAQLVEDLHRLKTGGTARGDKMAQTGKRIEKVLEAAAHFEQTHKLNIYKKAKLISLVREELVARQWDAADIDAINDQLLTSRLRKRPA